ncbi:MAG: hypothetical protein ACRC6V_19320 [Bacteroidales bacterium]
MGSYQAFLPKSGGGGSDTIGSITRMSTTMDPLVEVDGKTYMKEGYHLSEGPETFPEAYEKLTGKDGKQWDGIIESYISSSAIFRGIFATEIGIVSVYTLNTELFLYKVDAERSTMTKLHTYSIATGQFRSHAVYQSRCIWIWSDGKRLNSLKPSDIGAWNSTVTSISGMTTDTCSRGFAVGTDGIIWFPGSPATQYVYVTTSENANPNLSSSASYTQTFPTSMIQGGLFGGINFTEINNNSVVIMYTVGGELLWNGSGKYNSTNEWVVRMSLSDIQGLGLWNLFAPRYISVSAEADIVYVGDQHGNYFVGNGRLVGDGLGPNVTYGQFPALVQPGQCSWSSADGYIFFSPGPTFNTYYRFNKINRKWENYNFGSKLRLPRVVDNQPTLAKSGNTMVHFGDINGVSAGKQCVLTSTHKVMLPNDNSTEGGTSNYMRIK